nr:hypothetical protein [uncultured Mediterraneibacter sp.]
MKKEKKRNSIYHYSIGRLFWISGIKVLVIVLISEIVIAGIAAFSGYKDLVAILILLFIAGVFAAYVMPLLSLCRLFGQQEAIGIKYKNRTDFDKPENEREWFVCMDRGGFAVFHRTYIKRIIRSVKEEEKAYTDAYSPKEDVYILYFEDISGRERRIKFSGDWYLHDFIKWYQHDQNLKYQFAKETE